jgi:NAD(P)H-dependent FMN reductase
VNNSITIALLVGTVRAKRESIKAAHFVADYAKNYPNVELIFVDPQELMLIDEGEDVKDPRYSEITAKADAFIIVTPEYNHGYPSSLKRMLDSEYDNYKHKPVALVGASSGSWGGVRVCEALLPVCHRTGMVNIQTEMYFPKIQDTFDENGQIKPDLAERYDKNARALYEELVWFAKLLKPARQSSFEN